MNAIARVVVVCLVAVPFLLGGCSKEVTVTFVNMTEKPMDLEIINNARGIAMKPEGAIAPLDTRHYKIKLEKDDLPETYSWKVTWDGGAKNGTFTIDEDSAGKYTVVLPDGPYWTDKKVDATYTRKVNEPLTPLGEPEIIIEGDE